jgi:hypothetical protein
MASYQPPIDTTAIFNSQSFSANSYTGESDPNKLDFPNAQGTPTMPSVNISDGINASLITPTGITTSGTQGASTIDIIQIPEKNTVNTFTQNQVYGGTTQHNGGIFVPQTQSINLAPRNHYGIVTGIAPTALTGTTLTISGTTLTVIPANPSLVIGTAIFGANVTAGTAITAVLTPTTFTVNNSQTSTPSSFLLIGASSNVVQIQSISGTTLTLTGLFGVTLPVGTALFGTGITAGTRIVFVTNPTTYTLNVASTVSVVTNATYTIEGSNNLGYSLSQIYHIVPSPLLSYPIALPNITALNVGATTILRIINTSTHGVSVTSVSSIFAGTSSSPVNTHTIYNNGTSVTFASTGTTAAISGTTLTLTTTPPTLTVGTRITGGATAANTFVTAILTANTYTVSISQTTTPTNYIPPNPVLTSHTFMALPTTLGTGGFGWFQLGTV